MPDDEEFSTDAEQAEAVLSDPALEANEADVVEQAQSVTGARPGDPGFAEEEFPYEPPDPPDDQ